MIRRLIVISLAWLISGPALADCDLRADTAIALPIGPFLDATDAITPETGLTISQADVQLLKHGATTFAQKTDVTACTHRAGGWYTCPVGSTDTDIEGQLTISVQEAGAAPVWERCNVLNAFAYDAKYGLWAEPHTESGTAQAGSTSSITLRAGASATDEDPALVNHVIKVVSGTGAGQMAVITAYNGTSKVASTSTWGVAPDATSVYAVLNQTMSVLNCVAGICESNVVQKEGLDPSDADEAAATAAITAAGLVATLGTPAGSSLADDIATAQSDLSAIRRGLVQRDTTIATLASQVSFTLTAGSSDDNAYKGCGAMITDQATAEQIAMAGIQAYTGSTKTVTLDDDPAVFTMATGDLVTITCLGANAEFMNKSEVLGDGSAGNKWRGN